MARKSRPPRLTPEIIADDDLLWEQMDPVIRATVGHDRRRRERMRLQSRLQRMVREETWQLYLTVESQLNSRHGDELMAAARWAFAAGRSIGADRS